MLNPQSREVADSNINFRISDNLKNELQRALDKNDEFAGKMTPFFLDAIKAFVLQSKRKERIATPLEFVSDKSSDKAV